MANNNQNTKRWINMFEPKEQCCILNNFHAMVQRNTLAIEQEYTGKAAENILLYPFTIV